MLKSIELVGFKSFGKKSELVFESRIAGIVGPNGSGKSNVAEAFRFVLGEQSMKSLRSRRGEDLIWGGSPAMPRGNRAAVKVTFDNSKRVLDLDFSEVSIERIVYRDGQNEYLINGSKVRLKDVVRLLAGANIAGTGYQIISQGEADRILTASGRERREMVEDALGLKLYQHKKAESERKLEETAENQEKIASLRRELAPHLKFLRRQMEKIEKAREMQDELKVSLAEYLARERAWIDAERAKISHEREEIESKLHRIARDVENARAQAPESDTPVEKEDTVAPLEESLHALRREREDIVRELGRAEARAELVIEVGPAHVAAGVVRGAVQDITELCDAGSIAQALEDAQDILQKIRVRTTELTEHLGETAVPDQSAQEEVRVLTERIRVVEEKEQIIEKSIKEARAQERIEQEAKHEADRTLLTLGAKKRELEAYLRTVAHRSDDIGHAERQFEEEVREGVALLGSDAARFKQESIPEGALVEEREEQEKRRRAIERLKIKIEESGAGNADEVTKEFNQTKDRDEFLARELLDLDASAKKLRDIIEELDHKIDERFSDGLVKINEALKTFFTRLFGGGDARLELEAPKLKDDGEIDPETGEIITIQSTEEPVRGLGIQVQLPRKKVRGLEVLSGGERALTSIALIFAMSQVNPPPFLILDETDAALDEANSRRYADMVKILSDRSQLILITHNRATMSAAGELYGVTMSSDGVSKLLSVKLEEAEKVAK